MEKKAKAKMGIGDLAVKHIKDGLDNEAVLAKVKGAIKGTKATLASIAWYRNKLRSDGVKGIKTNRELTAKPKAPKKTKKAKTASKAADPLK